MIKPIHFTTVRSSDGVVFNVYPARPMSLWILIALALAFVFVMNMRSGFVAFAMLAIWALATFKYVSRFLRINRTPIPLTVDKSGLLIGTEFYPANDIAEFSVNCPQAPARSSNVVFMGAGLGGMFAAAGAQGLMNAGQSISDSRTGTSYRLLLRRRSNSTPILLIKGLTAQAGEALMSDIVEALS